MSNNLLRFNAVIVPRKLNEFNTKQAYELHAICGLTSCDCFLFFIIISHSNNAYYTRVYVLNLDG